MLATKALRSAAGAERTPMIKFLGKRTIPSSIDHAPKAHPASPSHELPADFTSHKSPTSFSSYRQQAQQHGPLGKAKGADFSIGAISGQSLGSVKPDKGEYFDRNELPARFRRVKIDLSEIDAIETGGATLVC